MTWFGVGVIAGLLAIAPAESPSKLSADLERAIAAGEDEAAIGIVRKLGDRNEPGAAEVLLSIAQKGIPERYYRECVAALARMEACGEFLQKEMARGKPERKIVILHVTAKMTGARGGDLIAAGLADKNAFVQRLAVEATRVRKLAATVPPLIDLLQTLLRAKVRDVLYYDVRDALTEITGQDFDAVEDWRNWWEANGKGFDPKKVEEGRTKVERKVRGGKTDPTFFGVPIASKNAVFVIDVSGSMLLVQKDDIPGLTEVGDQDKHGEGKPPEEKLTPENERLARYWMRIEMAKRALLKVLSGLSADTRFNIIAFHSQTVPYKKGSQIASPATRKTADAWVRGLQAKLHTNTLDALEAAFQSDPGLNTIYFLSDGIPMKDGVNAEPTGPILDRVLEINRYRSVKIHTFGFYPIMFRGGVAEELEKANQFLKALAEKTGGTFTYMKVDPNEKPPPDFK